MNSSNSPMPSGMPSPPPSPRWVKTIRVTDGHSRAAIFAGSVALFIIACLLVVAMFAAAVAFWSWVIMLVVGAAWPQWGWGFWDAVFPWGIVAALVFGVLGKSAS